MSDSNGNVYQVSGTYSVKGQNLSIRINTEDENYHFLTAAANVEFDMKLTMTISADAESDKIDFGGGVIKDVVVNTNHDLSVEKSGTYNKSEGKFEYTIRVVSTGKNSNVVITDNITGTLLTYNRDLTVESSLGTDAVSGSDVSTENGFTYTEAEMQHGEVLMLKYSANIDYSKITGENKFTAEQTGNSVTVNSDESDEEEDSYDFSNQIAYDKVSKRSTNVDSDEIDGQIVSWEIVLNPDCKVAVGGKTVSDMISEDSKKIMRYTGDGITVTKYDADGIKVGDPQKITWESLNVDTQTATEWNWTIPVDDNVPYKYVVTYNTVVDGSNLWETTGVSNGVKFDGDTASGSATVEPGNTWGVSKGHTTASSSSRTVDWVITVDVAAEGFDIFEVKDTLPSTWVNNVLYLHRLAGDVEVRGLQEGDYTYIYYDKITNNETVEGFSNSAFTLTFYRDSDKKTFGLQESSSGRNRTLTIEFTTEYPEGWTENSAHTNSVNVHTEHGDKGANDSLTLTTQKIEKTCESTGSDLSNDKRPYVVYHVAISGVDSDTVTVKDCFDTDIFELEYKQIYAQHGNYSWDTNRGYTSLSDCEVDYNPTDQGIEFTFKPEKDPNGQYFPWYGFCYRCR